MKITTNNKPIKEMVDKMESASVTDSEGKTVRIEKIKNGYITSRTWTDQKGKYKEEKVYTEKNPMDDSHHSSHNSSHSKSSY